MNQHRILPFYMTYPLPVYYQEEDRVMQDLEYLQQLYPADAKRYQTRIMVILDQLDYEGSVIYDEYPDRITLYKLVSDISNMLVREEESSGIAMTDEKKEWISSLVAILLFYEIYKRRHSNSRGFLRF
ncbi:MAG: hypothetical protein IKB01_05220 [Lachnospiraceae bacterium]|nr:hypothetical protein [Lachnospiraceae bacterium]MBR3683355.1 hypothetical protein [Lachnospiraceae bacterium]